MACPGSAHEPISLASGLRAFMQAVTANDPSEMHARIPFGLLGFRVQGLGNLWVLGLRA